MTPSWMVRAMPDIHLHSTKYTAESWAFWITWMAPYLLFDRLPDEHYQHLLLLVDIIKAVTSLELEEEGLDILDADVRRWHDQYEQYYYRYEMDRISTCPLTIHAIIHLVSSTRHAGPLSRIWEYVTERFMGKIARSVTSRQYPFSQLSETVKKWEQVKVVAIRYGLEKELFLADERRNWSILGKQETMIPEINDTTVLKSPHQANYQWTDAECRRVAVYIRQAYQLRASADSIMKELPKTVPRWGKFRVKFTKRM
ncbi:hypothetical protein M408DRAFT_311094 [Serendipita vermifera MAFF 305830]|uniref:Uncharacterized protein n=1 Tax=Serendipita vermifera MAFF 305830 TaxID=933852 RepID=A0A0C3A5L6_SERVB|nr:hypothetical protein M408DRAFT_311094 [Serendipita vermifera MAFF 305830]